MHELTGIAPGTVDLVAGGPPCQGFSIQRRGAADDPRNQLAVKFAELATALEPAAILLENVPGFLGARGKDERHAVLRHLRASGYETTSGVLQANGFGVPQSRRRAFIVAWNPNKALTIGLPEATLATPRTVRDAIGDLDSPAVDGRASIAREPCPREDLSAR